jgi:hypothetical protein
LCWRLRIDRPEHIRENLEASLEQAIARDELRREPCWTESLAVGSKEFVERMEPLMSSRCETEIMEQVSGLWLLKETEIPYRAEMGSESPSKV